MSEVNRILLIGAASYDIQNVANEVAGETLFPDPAPTSEIRVLNPSTPHYGRMIQLTVVPGFVDHRVNQPPRRMASVIKNELQSGKYRQGFQMAVVVMSYPFRWTDEERRTVNLAYEVVGHTNLKESGILILNNGHDFKKKYPQDTLLQFKNYLYQQGKQQAELQNFLSLFGENVLILDTELQDQELNGGQLTQFFKTVTSRYEAFRVQRQGRVDSSDEGFFSDMRKYCAIL